MVSAHIADDILERRVRTAEQRTARLLALIVDLHDEEGTNPERCPCPDTAPHCVLTESWVPPTARRPGPTQRRTA